MLILNFLILGCFPLRGTGNLFLGVISYIQGRLWNIWKGVLQFLCGKLFIFMDNALALELDFQDLVIYGIQTGRIYFLSIIVYVLLIWAFRLLQPLQQARVILLEICLLILPDAMEGVIRLECGRRGVITFLFKRESACLKHITFLSILWLFIIFLRRIFA